jgi:hypothetical protein
MPGTGIGLLMKYVLVQETERNIICDHNPEIYGKH